MTVQQALQWVGYAARISIEDAQRWVVSAGFDEHQLLSVGLLLEASPMVNLPVRTRVGKWVKNRCPECREMFDHWQVTKRKKWCAEACRKRNYRRQVRYAIA